MIKVRIKGKYGEVEVENHPKQMIDINGQPTIVKQDTINIAIRAYEKLIQAHKESQE